MMQEFMTYSSDKKEMYEEVRLQLVGLFEDCPHVIANLANASAVLNEAMRDINWVGFYLMKSSGNNVYTVDKSDTGEEILVLGPFQGKAACVEIRIGKGVCGTAVAEDRVQLVKNVHDFPGHIACDAASNSEIVLPIHKNSKVIGVLDIDSPLIGRFDSADQEGLERIVEVIEDMLCKNNM